MKVRYFLEGGPIQGIDPGTYPDEKNTVTSRENQVLAQKNSRDPVVSSSKKSPTGPTERTPKPEYLIALANYLGVRW